MKATLDSIDCFIKINSACVTYNNYLEVAFLRLHFEARKKKVNNKIILLCVSNISFVLYVDI